jgi:hypothetical protein
LRPLFSGLFGVRATGIGPSRRKAFFNLQATPDVHGIRTSPWSLHCRGNASLSRSRPFGMTAAVIIGGSSKR